MLSLSHALAFSTLAALTVAPTGSPVRLPPEEVARQIRFTTPAGADAKRQELIRFIWPAGLPRSLPRVSPAQAGPELSTLVDLGLVDRAERLEIEIGTTGFTAVSYLLHPVNRRFARRLAIVHQGHREILDLGLDRAINHLLGEGLTVAILHMPLLGWNTDSTGRLPDGSIFRVAGRGVAGHNELFAELAEPLGGSVYQLFLEPVVQVVNHFLRQRDFEETRATARSTRAPPSRDAEAGRGEESCDVAMIGISGGAWSTSMAAAVDERICLSIPIGGSAPLFARTTGSHDHGDAEQRYLPLYDESIAADGTGGGVATFLEVYILGGYGLGRRQISVSNFLDPCCFAGDFADSFAPIVSARLSALGRGSWRHHYDRSHLQHKISARALAEVIGPALGISTAVPTGLPVDELFADATAGPLPRGWALDPFNEGTAALFEAGLQLAGPGLSAVFRQRAFDPLQATELRLTLDLAEASEDSRFGLILTDDPYMRPRHFGVFLDMAERGLFLNADGGDGFDADLDRLFLGPLEGYDGGPLTFDVVFDTSAIAVDVRASNGAAFRSSRSWEEVPGGFSPASVGDWVYLTLQSSDTDGGTPAAVTIRRVTASAVADRDRAPGVWILALAVLLGGALVLLYSRYSAGRRRARERSFRSS